MSEVKLDNIDLAIIDLLQQDARMSAIDIAKKLKGSTPRVVRYRIDRLIREGVITLTAIVNAQAVGYPLLADMFVECAPGKLHEVAQRLTQLEQVVYVGAVTGQDDLSVSFVSRSVEELHTLVLNNIQRMSGVRHTKTYLVPQVLKDLHQWHIPRGDTPLVLNPDENEESV